MKKTYTVPISRKSIGVIAMNPKISKGGIILINSVEFSKSFEFEEGLDRTETTVQIDFPDKAVIEYRGKPLKVKLKILRKNPIILTKPLNKIKVQLKDGTILDAGRRLDKNGRDIYVVDGVATKRNDNKECKGTTSIDTPVYPLINFTSSRRKG